MSKRVYDIITQRIIDKLEEGVIPWKMPFQNNIAVNWETQKPYRGINTLLLEPGEYATFNKIRKSGGKVKKGSKANIAVLWKWIEMKDDDHDDERVKNVPFLQYYSVFEINTQVTGLESKRNVIEYEHDPIEEAENLVKGFTDSPEITYEPTGAWYRPNEDLVNVPNKKEFESIHKYYSTLFHELVHSTGHQSRLNRNGVTSGTFFGSKKYSKEELVAEIGASFLCGIAGIDNETVDNSASYIQSWLNALNNDRKLIIQASQQAQKASDHILNVGELNE